MKKALIFLCALSVMAFAIPAFADYIAVGGWDSGAVYILDNGFNLKSSFATGAVAPDAVATDGKYIYSGHFENFYSDSPSPGQVIAYDFNGQEQFRWARPQSLFYPYDLFNLQGMTMVGDKLAIYSRAGFGYIDFYNPLDGTYYQNLSIKSIDPSYPFTLTIEGLAYDGTLIWAIGDNLLGIDPNTGEIKKKIFNKAASIKDYGGTGIAIGGVDELVLVTEKGDWFRVSKEDGSVLASGNNKIDMHDVVAIPTPEPTTILLLGIGMFGLAGFRKRS